MKYPADHPALRVNPRNRDHHIWNNHGTWFVHYTVHTGLFKARRRASLGTADVVVARERRDALFTHLAAHAASPSAVVPPLRFTARIEGRAA